MNNLKHLLDTIDGESERHTIQSKGITYSFTFAGVSILEEGKWQILARNNLGCISGRKIEPLLLSDFEVAETAFAYFFNKFSVRQNGRYDFSSQPQNIMLLKKFGFKFTGFVKLYNNNFNWYRDGNITRENNTLRFKMNGNLVAERLL